jgi:spore coat polysaccharide biosynthesis protein SpsF (cytidylyltransferase family)
MEQKQKIVCLLQARMGSSRLPGKVLKPLINNLPSLYVQLKRVTPATKVNAFVVATSTLAQDDVIEDFCQNYQIPIFRGDEQNVLSRFYHAAVLHKADVVVRITADCPLHHYKVIDWCVEQYEKYGVDYFSNSNEPPVLEDGWDTEVFSFKALETAYYHAQKSYEKEHVTPFIKLSNQFTCKYQKYLSDYTEPFKLSLDNENDYKLIQQIFSYFHPDILFDVKDVLSFIKSNPQLLEINKSSVINESYYKDLKKSE